MMTTLANLTIQELMALIDEAVDRRLKLTFGEFELQDEDDSDDQRSLEEVLASIDRNRWTPPPGAKSSLELLREDRER
ncbi:MAG: hypothetical protein HZC41_16255 [Chloroflexi bacterium]|nr:hypothetical protein [Chloroflexota bacterium]